MSRHDKFKAYWESIGKPQLEAKAISDNDYKGFINIGRAPSWFEDIDYRIADDRHWELRRKWIDSDFKLKIELFDIDRQKWISCPTPTFNQLCQYREAPVITIQ